MKIYEIVFLAVNLYVVLYYSILISKVRSIRRALPEVIKTKEITVGSIVLFAALINCGFLLAVILFM